MPRGSLRCFRKKYSSHQLEPHSRRRRHARRRRFRIAAWKAMCRDRPACAGGRAPASGRRRRRTTPWWSRPCACSCARPARAGSTDGRSARCRRPRSAGLPSAPGICLRNSGANSPCTVENARRPSRRRGRHHRHDAAAACGRCAARACARSGPARPDRARRGLVARASRSSAQISSRRLSNQARARCFAVVDIAWRMIRT
jgi:hypothetical protein